MLVLLPPPPRRLRFFHLAHGLAWLVVLAAAAADSGVLAAPRVVVDAAEEIDAGRGGAEGGGHFGWGAGGAEDRGIPKGGGEDEGSLLVLEKDATDHGSVGGRDAATSLGGSTFVAADLPRTKARGLMMMKCMKKGGKKCRRPTRRPTPRPTGECSAVTRCNQGNIQIVPCRGSCVCGRDTDGVTVCLDPSRSTTLCSSASSCSSSVDCPVGEVCIPPSVSCCDFRSCTPLCLL